MKNFDGYKYIDGGVCAAKGFKANGLYCGIKSQQYLTETEIRCQTAKTILE